MNAKLNKDGRINFGVYYINDIYKWGYEVVDAIEKQALKRGYNYPSLEAARTAGFEQAKQIIEELDKAICLIPAEEGCSITVNPDGSIIKTYQPTCSENGSVEDEYTKENQMDKYELYAVGHHLSCWPENCSFTDLMQWLRLDNEELEQEIWPWELMEAVPLPDIADLIEGMVRSLRETFP